MHPRTVPVPALAGPGRAPSECSVVRSPRSPQVVIEGPDHPPRILLANVGIRMHDCAGRTAARGGSLPGLRRAGNWPIDQKLSREHGVRVRRAELRRPDLGEALEVQRGRPLRYVAPEPRHARGPPRRNQPRGLRTRQRPPHAVRRGRRRTLCVRRLLRAHGTGLGGGVAQPLPETAQRAGGLRGAARPAPRQQPDGRKVIYALADHVKAGQPVT